MGNKLHIVSLGCTKNLVDTEVMMGKLQNFELTDESGDADVIILDINSIFEYEEKKHEACKKDFTSIAIIDDPSDYDAFKNFGITAWIKRADLSKLTELLNEIKTRMSL